jgi:ribosome-binding protein aMBF1 (putative translation factor)
VQAASLYLQYVEKFTPKRRVVVDDRAASGLSNVELADELEAQVLHLRVVEDA